MQAAWERKTDGNSVVLLSKQKKPLTATEAYYHAGTIERDNETLTKI